MLPTTYRKKLFVYCLLLIALLTAVLVSTYNFARQNLLDAWSSHIASSAKTHNAQLYHQRVELSQYARLIAANATLHNFISNSGKTAPGATPITALLNWQAVNQKVIASPEMDIIYSDADAGFVDYLTRQPQIHQKGFDYYVDAFGHIEMVHAEPVIENGRTIAYLILSHSLEAAWQLWHQAHTNADVFVIKDQRVLYCSSGRHIGMAFSPQDGFVTMASETFRLHAVELPAAQTGLPQVWYGTSETELMNTLAAQGQRIFIVMILGVLLISGLGVIIIHNFDKPLRQLIKLTHQIADGKMPAVSQVNESSELDTLNNQFALMVDALRQKQCEIDKTQSELHQSAVTDVLTGLYNRRHLLDIFPKLQAQARRDRRALTAILFDIDHFKQLNDRFSHLAGDRALVEFARTLKTHTRDNDFLYRMGGEEFLVLSIGNNIQGSQIMAEKIRLAVASTPTPFKGKIINFTVSGGISRSLPQDDVEEALQQLLSRADKALYQAKHEGRNRICTYYNDNAQAGSAEEGN